MNRRKISILVGVVGILAVAVVGVLKWHFESDIRSKIETFLAELPEGLTAKAEKIDVSFFDKSVVITNLNAAYSLSLEGLDYPISITSSASRVIIAGLNRDGFKPGAGVAKLADAFIVEGLNVEDNSQENIKAASRTARYSMENISADVASVVAETKKIFPTFMAIIKTSNNNPGEEDIQKMLQELSGLFKAYESVHAGKYSFTGYQYDVEFEGHKINLTMADGMATDYSIRKIGPTAVNTVKATFNDEEVLTVDSIGLEEIALPSFVKLFEVLAKDPSPEAVLESLKGQPFAVKNLKLKNLRVTDPTVKGRTIFTMAEQDVNYGVENKALVLNSTISGLDIKKSLFGELFELPESVFVSLPDTITFEGNIEQAIALKDQMLLDLDYKKLFVKGTGLGEASLSFTLSDINPLMLAMRGSDSSTLKNFDFSMTDTGLSTVLFAKEAFENETTPEESRASAVESLRDDIEEETNKVEQEIMAALANFLERTGGTLQFTLNPEQPSSISQLMQSFHMDPEALGLTITFTPGK